MPFLLYLILLIPSLSFAQDLPLSSLKLPPGFTASIYAEVPGARAMTLGTKGTVFVGTRQDRVYAIIPDATSLHGTRRLTIASGLNMPNGVAFHQGALYVAEIGRILRYDNIENQLTHPPKPQIIINNLPTALHHGLRYIKFGPDGKLYLAIGVPCNTCLKDDPRFGTIMRLNPDGTGMEIYTKGIRNSVGFDWHPVTHELWFTDNGRDWMGDNLPPDKLNRAPQKGMNFGFPYYDGKNLPNPAFGKYPYSDYTPPTVELPAHVAALGMTFYTGKQFPSGYHHQIFIAEHGSWNRSTKIGYQVILANITNHKVTGTHPFITGWLQGQSVWGRPVDLLVMPDGALLISDDHAGVIYRIQYKASNKS
jgi:glucose/arabinose dehydrogenase